MPSGLMHERKWTAPLQALLLLVLAMALAAQAVLVSAHRHEPAGRSAVAGAASRTAGHHDGHSCAVCEMQRVGGHYLPVVGPAPLLAIAAAWLPGVAQWRPLPRLPEAVGWHSRAPPVIGRVSTFA